MNNTDKSFKNIIRSIIAIGIVALSSVLGFNVYENTQEPSDEYSIVLTNPSSQTVDATQASDSLNVDEVIDYAEGTNLSFANEKALNEHYEKHGIEMGFKSAKEYEHAAANVVMNPNSLFKYEKEDGDEVYYLEATNEFVIVAKNTGYIRTYFNPSNGIKYFNKQ